MTDQDYVPRPAAQPPIAADGGVGQRVVNSFDEFVRFQEDGQLNAELSEALQKLSSDMSHTAIESGGKAKGKLVLTMDFALEGRVFSIASKFKVDVPDAKRPKSVMWTVEDGRFTPQNPQQGNLFGVRDVSGRSGFRDA